MEFCFLLGFRAREFEGWMDGWMSCWEDFVEFTCHNFLRGCASCTLRRVAAARTANLSTIVELSLPQWGLLVGSWLVSRCSIGCFAIQNQ